MPPVIIAAASAVAGAFAASLVPAAWGAFAVAAVKFGVAFVVTAIGNKLIGGRPDVPSSERRETIRQASANRRVSYGTVRTGGVLVHAVSTGDENKYMHMIIVLQHGEIDYIDPVFYLNNKPSTDHCFKGKVHAEYFLGKDDQTACQSMMNADPSGWTADHRLRGVAYAYLRLEYDQDAFPTGLPTASFIIRGRKVFDPRNPTAAPVWSDNTALCILDYIRAPWGLNAPDDLIDFASFITEANVCDELVESIDPALNGKLKRYTCNGMIDLGAAPANIIESMQSSCAGNLIFSNGKYKLFTGRYNHTSAVINKDMLRGDAVIRMTPSRSQLFNTVRGSYVEPRQDWQEYAYPPRVNAPGLENDGGIEIAQTINFPFTTIGATAQRLSKIAVRRAAGGPSITLPLNWSGLQFQLWQIVRLDLPGPQQLQEYYRIVEYTLAEGGGIDVTLQAENIQTYDWNPYEDETIVPTLTRSNSTAITLNLNLAATNVPPIVQVPSPRLTFSWAMQGYSNAAAIDLINSKTISGFLVQWRKASSYSYVSNMNNAFVKSLDSSGKFSFSMTGLEPNTAYYVRVRAAFPGGDGGPWLEVLLKPGVVAVTDGVLINLEKKTLSRTLPATTADGKNVVGGEMVLAFQPDGRLQLSCYSTVSSTNSQFSRETFPMEWSAGSTALTAQVARRFLGRATLIGEYKGVYTEVIAYNNSVKFDADKRTPWVNLSSLLSFGISFDKAKDGYAFLPIFVEIKDTFTEQIVASAYYYMRLDIA